MPEEFFNTKINWKELGVSAIKVIAETFCDGWAKVRTCPLGSFCGKFLLIFYKKNWYSFGLCSVFVIHTKIRVEE